MKCESDSVEDETVIMSTEKSQNINKFKNVLGVREKLNVSYAALAPKKTLSNSGKDSKIKCSKCYFRSTSNEHLALHMKEVHSRQNLLRCPACNYTASDEAILNYHMECHPDVKCHKCPLCEFLTTSKSNFEVHTIKCHLKRYYFCKCCDFGTFNCDEFAAHKSIHPPPPTTRTAYRNINIGKHHDNGESCTDSRMLQNDINSDSVNQIVKDVALPKQNSMPNQTVNKIKTICVVNTCSNNNSKQNKDPLSRIPIGSLVVKKQTGSVDSTTNNYEQPSFTDTKCLPVKRQLSSPLPFSNKIPRVQSVEKITDTVLISYNVSLNEASNMDVEINTDGMDYCNVAKRDLVSMNDHNESSSSSSCLLDGLKETVESDGFFVEEVSMNHEESCDILVRASESDVKTFKNPKDQNLSEDINQKYIRNACEVGDRMLDDNIRISEELPADVEKSLVSLRDDSQYREDNSLIWDCQGVPIKDLENQEDLGINILLTDLKNNYSLKSNRIEEINRPKTDIEQQISSLNSNDNLFEELIQVISREDDLMYLNNSIQPCDLDIPDLFEDNFGENILFSLFDENDKLEDLSTFRGMETVCSTSKTNDLRSNNPSWNSGNFLSDFINTINLEECSSNLHSDSLDVSMTDFKDRCSLNLIDMVNNEDNYLKYLTDPDLKIYSTLPVSKTDKKAKFRDNLNTVGDLFHSSGKNENKLCGNLSNIGSKPGINKNTTTTTPEAETSKLSKIPITFKSADCNISFFNKQPDDKFTEKCKADTKNTNNYILTKNRPSDNSAGVNVENFKLFNADNFEVTSCNGIFKLDNAICCGQNTRLHEGNFWTNKNSVSDIVSI